MKLELARFTQSDGEVIYINPHKVKSVRQHAGGTTHTAIYFDDKDYVVVSGEITRIAQFIEKATF